MTLLWIYLAGVLITGSVITYKFFKKGPPTDLQGEYIPLPYVVEFVSLVTLLWFVVVFAYGIVACRWLIDEIRYMAHQRARG